MDESWKTKRGSDLIEDMIDKKIDVEDLSSEQISPFIQKKDHRMLRLTEIFAKCAGVMKDDIKDHPWKLFFYILPIPPFGAVAVAAGTLLHIALGFTKRAREHRKNVIEGFRAPINYQSYGEFMTPETPSEKVQEHHIGVNWQRLRENLTYTAKIKLLNLSLEWSASLPDNRLSHIFNRGLERKIISTQTKHLPKDLRGKMLGDLSL